VAAVAGVLGAGFEVLRRVFTELEARTKLFSSTYKILSDELSQASSLFQPVVDIFDNIASAVTDLGQRAFGFLVSKIAAFFSFVTSIASSNPFGVFSDETVSSLVVLSARLDQTSKEIADVGFDLRNLESVARDVAGTISELQILPPFDPERLNRLREEFRNFGKTETQILQQEFAQRLVDLDAANQAGLLKQQEFNQLRLAITSTFNQQSGILEENALADSAITFENYFQQVRAGFNSIGRSAQLTGRQVSGSLVNGIANAAGSAFASFGSALVKGENALSAFAKSAISSIGQIAVQQGTAFILQGIGYLFTPQASFGPPLIKAGAALATFGGGLSAFGGGGASAAPSSTQGSSGGFSGQGQPSTATSGEFDREERRSDQSVQVIVQGDILDSEETGTRILKIISDNFKTSNSAFIEGRFA